jgi:outer membrane protein assembly factor BamB
MFIKSWKLHAYDVYTGRRLWETALPFSFNVNDQMVVVDDALYLASGKTCLVLDPATGRKKGQIDLPAGLTAPWANLRVWQGYLVGQSGQHLVCLHRHSGRLGWKYECGRRNLSLALGGGKVFFAELTDPKGKGQTGKRPQCRALDIQTGKLVWQIPGGSEVRYCPSLDRVVLFSGIYHARDGSLAAALPDLSPKDAKTKPENVPKPLFVIGRKVLMGTAESFVVCDLQSGQTEGKATTWKRRGCTIPRAGSTLVTTRVLGNAACIDLDSREFITFWNVRAACSNNLFPADGVLNMPSLTLGCTCNYLPVSQAYISAPALQGVNLPQK